MLKHLKGLCVWRSHLCEVEHLKTTPKHNNVIDRALPVLLGLPVMKVASVHGNYGSFDAMRSLLSRSAQKCWHRFRAPKQLFAKPLFDQWNHPVSQKKAQSLSRAQSCSSSLLSDLPMLKPTTNSFFLISEKGLQFLPCGVADKCFSLLPFMNLSL